MNFPHKSPKPEKDILKLNIATESPLKVENLNFENHFGELVGIYQKE